MVRVTQNLLSNQVLFSLQRNLARLADIQLQVSTGRQYQRVSDNPIDYTQSLAIRQEILAERRYVRNGEISITTLQLTDTALGDVTSLLQRARELTLSAANQALPPESLTGIADEIGQIFLQALQVANSSYQNGYLFAGNQTLTRPFAFAGGHVVYQGDDGQRQVEIGRGALLQVSLNGLETFIAQPNVLRSAQIADVRAPLAGQLGAGILPLTNGTVSINGKTFLVHTDPAQDPAFNPTTDSLEDLRDAINALDADVVARIDNGRLILRGNRSVDIQIESGTNVHSGNVLAALGLFRTLEGGPLTDTNNPPGGTLTLTTRLADLSPTVVPQGVRITLDGSTVDVDLRSAVTVGDVISAVRTATNGRVDGTIGADGKRIVFSANYTAEAFAISDLRRAFGRNLGAGPITLSTPLGSLGLLPLGTLVVSNGRDSASIDLSTLGPAQTVANLIARIEAAGLNVDVEINAAGNGLDLVSRDSTLVLDVQPGAGATALGWTGTYDRDNAADLGVRKTGVSDEQRTRSVFQTLIELENTLRSGGNAARLNALLGEIDADLTSLLDARATVGARTNRVEAAQTRSNALDTYMVSLLSQREDVDLAQALTDLATRENVLHASLNAASRILQPSLINFLV